MTDNTPTTKQDEGGLALVERLRADWEASRSHFVRSPRMTLEDVRDARLAHERLTSYYNWLPGLLAALSAPATPPHNEDGLRKALRAAADALDLEGKKHDCPAALAAATFARQALGDIPSG